MKFDELTGSNPSVVLQKSPYNHLCAEIWIASGKQQKNQNILHENNWRNLEESQPL